MAESKRRWVVYRRWWRAAVAWSTVKRSLIMAAIVGPTLTVINQWPVMLGREPLNLWQAVLTFVVPYCVATVSVALSRTTKRGHS